TAKDNLVHHNVRHGIMLETASSNTFFKNNCTWNGLRGFYTDAFSSNNTACLNYFGFNTVSQAWDDGSGNIWDTPIGNTYGDYTTRYPLATNDGILWNTPYLLDGAAKAVDRRPVYSAIGTSTPVRLTSNSQVDAYFSGNGTDGLSFATAHRLQDLKIAAGGGDYCIQLENVDRHVIIENCTLITAYLYASSSAAIKLQNCSNIMVRNNNIRYNSIGIKHYQTNRCIMENNTISKNSYEGLYIFQSHNMTITSNEIHDNDVNGIHQWYYCKDNNITSNRVHDNRINAIVLQDEENTTISKNWIANNYIGLQLLNTKDLLVKDNHVLNSTYYGMGIFDTMSELVLESNQIIESRYAGIYIWNAHGMAMNSNSMVNASIIMEGVLEHLRSCSIDTSNTVNGKSVYYYHDQNGLTPANFTNAGQVILVNCNASTVAGINCGYGSIGIIIHYCENVSVTSSTLHHFTSSGMFIKTSTNCTVASNTISNCIQGIQVSSCHGFTMTGNSFINCGLVIDATVEQCASYSIGTSNSVNGRVLRYHVDQSGLPESTFANAGQIILINCSNARITGQNVSRATIGIHGLYCTNINITTIDARGNGRVGMRFSFSCRVKITRSDVSSSNQAGIWVDQSSFFTISSTMVDKSIWGIFLDRTSDSKVSDNEISTCDEYGLSLSECSRIIVERNDVSKSKNVGIFVNLASFNQITANEIHDNEGTGIVLYHCKWARIVQNNVHGNGYGVFFYQNTSHNLLYFNSFSNSYYSNVMLDFQYFGTNNTWTNGTEGNYWDDYATRYPGATNLGRTWGTPYYLNGSISEYDPHPLVHPWQPNIRPSAMFVVQASSIVLTAQPVKFLFLGGKGNEPASFQWNFGDGTAIQAEQSPTHQFTMQGTYTITLTIVDADGQSSVLVRPGYIEVYLASGDFDGDGLTNEQEILLGTDLKKVDTDGDGFPDKVEVDLGTDPKSVISSPLMLYILPAIVAITMLLALVARAKQKARLQVVAPAPASTQSTDEELVQGSRLMQEKIDAKKAILSRVLEPQTSEEGDRKATVHVARKKEAEHEEVVTHQVDEQTEREVNVFKKKEFCIVCNASLKATTYICPHCETKYCMRCAIALSDRKEPCWACQNPMNFNP
ncbi:MAG: PKD domain-containing protein, partial [Candidatus Lokiarchaeota archaeon]|nr:PKD domain-containing protein [Candidatus Lokiarchaeota archaeon]